MSDYNAAERRHVREAQKAAKADETQRRDFIRATLSHVQGRLWFLTLLERAHVFASSFTGNALQTAFNEGERNIGLIVLNDIMTFCPDEYIKMMRERNERDATAESRRRSTNSDGRDSGSGGDPDYAGADED